MIGDALLMLAEFVNLSRLSHCRHLHHLSGCCCPCHQPHCHCPHMLWLRLAIYSCPALMFSLLVLVPLFLKLLFPSLVIVSPTQFQSFELSEIQQFELQNLNLDDHFKAFDISQFQKGFNLVFILCRMRTQLILISILFLRNLKLKQSRFIGFEWNLELS